MGGKQQHSGLQKRVIALYRECLRQARAQPTEEARHNATQYVKHEFRRNATTVKRTDIGRIEHLMRHAHRQLKLVRMPGVVGFNFGTVQTPQETQKDDEEAQNKEKQNK